MHDEVTTVLIKEVFYDKRPKYARHFVRYDMYDQQGREWKWNYYGREKWTEEKGPDHAIKKFTKRMKKKGYAVVDQRLDTTTQG